MSAKKSTRSTSDIEEDTFQKLTDINDKLNVILSKLTTIQSRLNTIESKQSEFDWSLLFIHQENEDIQTQYKAMAISIAAMEAKINKLQVLENRVEANEHSECAKCVKLNGISYKSPKDLTALYQKIVTLLKPNNLPFTGVDKIYRIRQTKKAIIEFTETDQCNEFFHIYRRNTQPLSALGFNEQGKIYINKVETKVNYSEKLANLRWITTSNLCGLIISTSIYVKSQILRRSWLTLKKISTRSLVLSG